MQLNESKKSSNNTNKLSPQEHIGNAKKTICCSNNTNKLSPQEPWMPFPNPYKVQIIQINLVLKNCLVLFHLHDLFK